MRKKSLKVILILIIAIFSIQLKVQAAVITSTDKEVESNSGNVTISVTSKQVLGAYTLKLSDNAGLELVGASGGEISTDKKTITGSSATGTTNLGTYTFKVPTVTIDTTYKIKFSISGMETTSLEEIEAETNIAVLKVKAPVVETEPETPPVTTTPETVAKSSEARLSNFGIKPKECDFTGFKKDKYEYSTSVPNNVSEVEIYADVIKDSNATVEGVGKVSLKEGNNKFEVKVTAEDGKTTKTYTLTIKRKTAAEEETENGEARLKSLSIKPKECDFTGFDSETTEYSVEVLNEVKEIEVVATAMDSRAQITGIGIIELAEGKNDLKIEVIAANGNKKTYTLEVTRKKAESTLPFGLSILKIDGLKLVPSFKVDTYAYTAELTEDLTSLEINAKSNDNDANVEIIGNKNLQEGENVITIQVRNNENDEIATYQIIVNKNIKAEEVVLQTSWLKPSTWGKEEKIKLLLIIVLIILIISAILLKIKIAKESDIVLAKDLPGAEELDKAIAEHQELSGEEINNQENTESFDARANYLDEIARSRAQENNKNIYESNFEPKIKRKGKHF